MRSIFLLFTFILATVRIQAQNYDADSIYYTTIPVAKAKQHHNKRVFQDTIKNDELFTYFFILQAGTLVGCNDCSEGKEITFTSSTIHGVMIGKKLRAGLGIGLDSYYAWHTMPVFGSLTFDVFGTKNTSAIFVQFNYGWSKAWLNKTYQDYGYQDADGGPMVNTQLGYRLKYHDLRISLSIGTKYQRVTANYEYPTYHYTNEGVMILGTPSTTTVQQSMNRLQLALTVGWK